jgi:hypothetical protein
LPVLEYGHADGCSVSGGHVYRGGRYPALQGLYLYGDYCSGRTWGVRRQGSTWANQLLLSSNLAISTFGEDESGEIYVGDYSRGDIYRIESTVLPTVIDFDNNGAPDVLWQEDANRVPVVWFMGGTDGSTPLNAKVVAGPVHGWKLVACADLDRNGKPDLLWQEDANRTPVVWYMGGADGTTVLSGKAISGPIPAWTLVASADLDGNNRPDLLWQEDASGVLVVWFMGGADGSTPLSGKVISGPIEGWRLAAAADLDGNGKPDLLWLEQGPRVPVVWYMGGADGTTVLSGKAISGPIFGWKLVAGADLNRDGKPDLLWQEDANRVFVVWYMGGSDGSTPVSGKVISGPIPGWSVVGPK